MRIKLKRDVLYRFIESFWFAPNDCLLRAVETSIWDNLKGVKRPILEIGTGDGRNDRYLFRKIFPIDFGIDVDAKALSIAEKSNQYKKLLKADSAEMPFRNATFNCVIANSTLEHVRRDIGTIQEVSRVLRLGGLFVFSVPTDKFKKYMKDFGIRSNEFLEYNKRVEHLHYRSIEEWKNILYKNNLVIEDSLNYFPKDVLNFWYKLHKIVVFKPYKRELWSYLKDSPYGRIIPKKMVISLEKRWLYPYYKQALNDSGAWVFLITRKI